jgi:mono/diheme cytochrome c family protein
LKTVLKVLGGLVLLVVVVIAGFAGYISMTWDKDYSAIEKPKITASTDPEVIKRGEYVAHSIAHCSICHATREVTEARKPGEHPAMSGGFEWKMGPMGTLYSRNITPDPETGIGKWSDEDLGRAIKWGVGPDGKLLPFMSMAVPALADEDVMAVVSYIRSTAPVKLQNKPHEVGVIMKWMATKMGPDFRKPFFDNLKYVAAVEEPSIARGEYLARGPATCVGCHTAFDMMAFKIKDPPFAGSDMAEPDHENPEMEFAAPNLTPDPETGHIAKWDQNQFIQRFRAGRLVKTSKMPWEAFREMTDSDLKSVYMFLQSLPPTKRYVGPPYRKAGHKQEVAAAADGKKAG